VANRRTSKRAEGRSRSSSCARVALLFRYAEEVGCVIDDEGDEDGEVER
jgi:hypothetical protein